MTPESAAASNEAARAAGWFNNRFDAKVCAPVDRPQAREVVAEYLRQHGRTLLRTLIKHGLDAGLTSSAVESVAKRMEAGRYIVRTMRNRNVYYELPEPAPQDTMTQRNEGQ